MACTTLSRCLDNSRPATAAGRVGDVELEQRRWLWQAPGDPPDKDGLLADWSAGLLADRRVDHVDASLLQIRESKFYRDGATTALQQRVRLHPELTAVAVEPSGRFETMRTLAPPAGRGWEYLTGTGWDFPAELARLRRGSAGSRTAADHLEILDTAVTALPLALRRRRRVMVICDSEVGQYISSIFLMLDLPLIAA
jgi:hypothetical protein